MKSVKSALLALIAVFALTPSARAQCAATPLQALVGTWTFSTDPLGVVSSGRDQVPVVSAGRFTASVSGLRGILAITATSSIAGTVTRLETDAGSFQVDDNCSGGTLTFNLSSRPVQYEFYFVNANEIAIVANNHNDGDSSIGSARRVVDQVCPALSLQVFAGAWVFSTSGYSMTTQHFLSSGGRMVASIGTDRGGNPLGLLALSVTSTVDGSPVRREADAGRFQVNADCTGGTLTFNLSSRPVQFDFFFSSANHMVMVDSNQGDVIVGSARRLDLANAPVCTAAPLQALAGSWTFSSSALGSAYAAIQNQAFPVSAGQFTAAANGDRGILRITATSAVLEDGPSISTTRLETDAGSFQVDDDCRGGTLTFNLSSRPVQYEFYFVNADELVIVGNFVKTGETVIASARRFVPQACPALPLQALAGDWVFSTLGLAVEGSGRTGALSSAGRFSASIGTDRGGNPLGVLALNVTTSLFGSPVRRESDVGRFQVNADCSGGTLTFNLSSRPAQFDFFFSSNNRIVMVGSNQSDVVVGSARRFGSN